MITQTIHWAARVAVWIAIVLVFVGTFTVNRGSAKHCSNGNIKFAPRWWFVFAWVVLLVRLGIIGADLLRTWPTEHLQFWTGALLSISVILPIFMVPGILVVTHEALLERNWLWRSKKIRWTEIQEIRTEKKGSAITVIGLHRSKIVYTNIYPDRAQFLIEIRNHCGDNLPSNFPGEPLNSNSAV
jgi:hypothetical protein